MVHFNLTNAAFLNIPFDASITPKLNMWKKKMSEKFATKKKKCLLGKISSLSAKKQCERVKV